MKISKLFGSLIFSVIVHLATAQHKDFHFENKISDFKDAGWYSLYLPDSIFSYINREFTDIRIFRLHEKDTLEEPYILKILESEITDEVVELPMINKSTKDGKFYCTFELKKNQHVNYLDLDFEEHNFNGYAQLEGSLDQKEWFLIDSLHRILSIHRDDVDFKSTTLNFPETTYSFLRLSIKADKPLILTSASFKNRETKPGLYTKATLTFKITNSRPSKQSSLDVRLTRMALVSKVCISTDHSTDFYRPITIEALRDSSKTPKGWAYYYETIYSGTITSLDDKCFEFPHAVARKLKITIHNADNSPLEIKSIEVFGPLIQLVARLQPGDNHLFYGNPGLGAPSYDIVHFEDKIPPTLTALQLLSAENLYHPIEKKSPLLESKIWLWAVMGIVILVLGYFTLTMMKKKE
jgi:hypothetical protein